MLSCLLDHLHWQGVHNTACFIWILNIPPWTEPKLPAEPKKCPLEFYRMKCVREYEFSTSSAPWQGHDL